MRKENREPRKNRGGENFQQGVHIFIPSNVKSCFGPSFALAFPLFTRILLALIKHLELPRSSFEEEEEEKGGEEVVVVSYASTGAISNFGGSVELSSGWEFAGVLHLMSIFILATPRLPHQVHPRSRCSLFFQIESLLIPGLHLFGCVS